MQMRSYSTFDQPRNKRSYHLKSRFQLPTSKSLILVMMWIIVVGFISSAAEVAPYYAVSRLYGSLLLYIVLGLYILLAVAMMCYPLGGLLADVYFGRYKIIRASLIMIALSMLLALLEFVASTQFNISENSNVWKKIVHVVGGGSAFFALAIGLAGFTSNIVQFGLDQLQDAPSNKLGAFVHMYVLADRIGYTAFATFYSIKQCYFNFLDHPLLTKVIMYTLPGGCFVALSALLLFNCFTHRMFNKERVKYNPYKTIFRILNFARKHKRPVGHPSAFAYCDTFRPSRMDYAKERYGGPFTTSDVEDVKTFLKVFLMLTALGPIFVIVVPTSFFLFSTFAIHTGTYTELGRGKCSAEWVLLQSGLLSEILSSLIMPLYTWLLFSVLYRKNLLPKIIHRILFAALLFSLTPVNMLIVDLTGHLLKMNNRYSNETCLFSNNFFNKTDFELLNLHWSI